MPYPATAPSKNKKYNDLLQSDFNSVGSWENIWLKQFNADKCSTMKTSRKKTEKKY